MSDGDHGKDGPILDAQRIALGRRRMEEHFTHHATVQFMLLMLTTTIASASGAGYGDAALACLKQDAEDLRVAADAYAKWAAQLADDWRAQRISQRGA